MPTTVAPERKQQEVKRGKIEEADTYLGLASKLLTIFAALSTLSIWLYTSYYVGSLEIRPDRPVEALTIKLYDERGMETVYHTGRLKVVPGRYQITVISGDSAPARCEAEVKFNGTTVVPYVVPQANEMVSEDAKAEEKPNRRWWQIWKRN